MAPRAIDGTDPPPTVAAALAACDVYIAPTSRSISHTPARKAATEAGARGATLPGVTADMLARLMAVDFDALHERCVAVADLLTEADEAHVTCPRGTDLRLDLSGPQGHPRRRAAHRARGVREPAVRRGLHRAARRRGAAGRARASRRSGLVQGEPALLTVADDHLVAATQPEGQRLLAALREHGDLGTTVAELGVGTNDAATLTGNVLEDEKILGTVHVAFGASAGFGGTVSVPIHLDCVVLDASLTIGGKPVLEDGRFVL